MSGARRPLIYSEIAAGGCPILLPPALFVLELLDATGVRHLPDDDVTAAQNVPVQGLRPTGDLPIKSAWR